MLRAVLILGIAATLGANLGVVLYALTRQPVPTPAPVEPSIPTPTVAATFPPAARSEARLRGSPTAPTIRLMVNEGAYLMQEQALDEHDDETLFWVWGTYEKLDVETGSRVRILKRDPTGVHVEVLEGRHVGRRGWVSEIYLGP